MCFSHAHLEPDDTDGEPDADEDAGGDDDERVAGAEGAPPREGPDDAQLQLDARHGEHAELLQDGLAARHRLLDLLLDAAVSRQSSVRVQILKVTED